MASVDLRLWLGTFHNQRNLAHQTSLLFSVVLLVAGVVTSMSQPSPGFGDFDDFDGFRQRHTLAWGSCSLGVIACAINSFLSHSLAKAELHNPLVTDEQMSVRRTKTAVVGLIGLSAVAVSQFLLLAATIAQGFICVPISAFLAGCMALITIGYDVAYLVRPSRITLEEAVTVPLTYDEFDP